MVLSICSTKVSNAAGWWLIDLFFQFYEKFGREPKKYGPSKDWNVDLIPKFIMAGGKKDTHKIIIK